MVSMFKSKAGYVFWSVVAGLIGLLLGFLGSHQFSTAATVGATVAICTLLYLLAVNKINKLRKLGKDDWRWDVLPSYTGNYLSDESFDRIRHLLKQDMLRPEVREDRVYWVQRRYSTVVLVARTVLMILFLLISIRLMAWAGEPWFAYPVVVAAYIGGFAANYLDWSTRYVMITNRRFIIAHVPPVWLPFIPGSIKQLDVQQIEYRSLEDSVFGNFLGFGDLQLDTKVQQDKWANNIRYLPHHNEIHRMLESVVEPAPPGGS
jgi:hypothetical protein